MIHYHGTPVSSRLNASKILNGKHALIPHPCPSYLEVAAEVCQSFVLDNGVFSHFTAGTPKTEWGDYYKWAEKCLKIPSCDWALIPDVIGGDAEQNDALLSQWPHGKALGVPVYHMHEPVERLSRLASEWPRVALGSSGDYWQVGSDNWWRRMSEMMLAVCDSTGAPRCRLHGLRMLDWRIFTELPLASADSVNVGINCGRTANLYSVDPVAGAAVILARIEAHNSAQRWAGACRKNTQPSESTKGRTERQCLLSEII
jgi:hypothetical protein